MYIPNIALLYPDIRLPQSFEEKYATAYVLQSMVNKDILEWIKNIITSEQKMIIIRSINNLLEYNNDEYDTGAHFKLRRLKEEVVTAFFNGIKNLTVADQLYKIAELNLGDYHFADLIPLLKTPEDYNNFIYAVVANDATHHTYNIVKDYKKVCQPSDLKKLLTRPDIDNHTRLNIYCNLSSDLKKFMKKEVFTIDEIFKYFDCINLSELTIQGSINIVTYVTTSKFHEKRFYGGDFLCLDSLDNLRTLLKQKITSNIESNITNVTGNMMRFYESQAKKNGFLGDFYQFMLLEGDAFKNKELWDKSVVCLRENITAYIAKHPKEARTWHPIIAAILDDTECNEDTSAYPRLESVVDSYLKEYVKIDASNVKTLNKLLGMKSKNIHLAEWKHRNNKTYHQEIEITL